MFCDSTIPAIADGRYADSVVENEWQVVTFDASVFLTQGSNGNSWKKQKISQRWSTLDDLAHKDESVVSKAL